MGKDIGESRSALASEDPLHFCSPQLNGCTTTVSFSASPGTACPPVPVTSTIRLLRLHTSATQRFKANLLGFGVKPHGIFNAYLCLITCLLVAIGPAVMAQELPVVQKATVNIQQKRNPWEQADSASLGTSNYTSVQQESGLYPVTSALQQLPGLMVRDYGGIGGIKAVSMRGMGAEHTQTLLNGFQIGANSLAYTDYGLLPSMTIDRVSVRQMTSTGPTAYQLSAGPQVNLQSTGKSTPQLEARFAGGSFGYWSPALAWRKQLGNHSISTELQHQQADGAFDFSIPNGDKPWTGTRQNTASSQTQALVHWQLEQEHSVGTSKWEAQGNLVHSWRQLPGAVVLYQPDSKQQLLVTQGAAGLRYTRSLNQWYWGSQLEAQHDQTQYRDPSFWNQTGGLHSRYHWQQVTGSGFIGTQLGQWNLQASADYQHQQLPVNGEASASNPMPWRNQVLAAARANHAHRFTDHVEVTHLLQVGTMYAQELAMLGTEMGQQKGNTQILTGMAEHGWNIRLGQELLSVQINTKRHARMPSFAEVYYGQAWGRRLLPEVVNQAGLQVAGTLNRKGNFHQQWQVATYLQQVDNKLVAIPTRDLFVWSITNVGRAAGFGMEAQWQGQYHATSGLWLNYTGQVTLQHLQDLTHTDNASYGGQLPYLPFAQGAARVQAGWQNMSAGVAMQAMSYRYQLAENTPENALPGFGLWDAFVAYRMPLNPEQALQWSAGIYNLADEQYQLLANYPLPGRHFKLSCSFIIH